MGAVIATMSARSAKDSARSTSVYLVAGSMAVLGVLTALEPQAPAGEPPWWAALPLLMALTVVTEVATAATIGRWRGGGFYDIKGVTFCAASILLAPYLVLLVAAAGSSATSIRHRRPWTAWAHDTAVSGTVAALGGFLFRCVAPAAWVHGHESPFKLAAALAVAIVVPSALGLWAIAFATAKMHSLPVRETAFASPTMQALTLGQTSLGYLVAIAYLRAPSTLVVYPFLLLPLVISARMLRLDREKDEDAKTGLLNFGGFVRAARREIARAERLETPLTLLMIDLDNFRHFNATFGRLAADRIVQRVGDLLSSARRDYDVLARFGGDEFLLLLADSQLTDALTVAERLRRSVGTDRVLAQLAPGEKLTLSIGATERLGSESIEAMIEWADQASYAAKEAGRDCIRAKGQESTQ